MTTPNTLPATGGVSDAKPLQGLAAYLRAEAGGTFQGSPNWQTLLQWANEVDAAQSRQASAQGGERAEAIAWMVDGGLVLREDWAERIRHTRHRDGNVGTGRAIPDAWTPVLFAPPPAGGGKEALSDAERMEGKSDAI